MDAAEVRTRAKELADMAVKNGKQDTRLPGGFMVVIPDASAGIGPQLAAPSLRPVWRKDGAEDEGESWQEESSGPGPSLSYDYSIVNRPDLPGENIIASFLKWEPEIRAFLTA